jgi:hypothetical protein
MIIAIDAELELCATRGEIVGHRQRRAGTDVPFFDIVRSDDVNVAGGTPAPHVAPHRINAKSGNRRALPMNIGAPVRRQATLTSTHPGQAGVPGL